MDISYMPAAFIHFSNLSELVQLLVRTYLASLLMYTPAYILGRVQHICPYTYVYFTPKHGHFDE